MKERLQPLRALLIEDSEDDALLLVEALRRGGYEVKWERVETESALRAALAAGEWEVVFCDYAMPKFDAPSALCILRETGDTLTAIVVSGQVGEEVAVEAMRMGANDFILKQNLARVVPAMERELRAAEVRRERQAAALALRQSEERYRVLFDQSPWSMWVYDPEDLRFLAVNERAVTEYGYTRDEYLSMTIKDIRPAEDVPELLEYVAAIRLRGEAPPRRSWRHLKKDGTMIDVQIAGQPITFHGEAVRVVQGIDVTEAKRAEQQIREQAELLDHAQDAILVHDLGGEIRYWNRSAERVFGWVREEVQGQKVQNLLYENPGRYETALKTALAEGAWIGETTKRTKAGRDVLIECRWTLVRDEAGQPKSIFAINTDITEKKEIEARFFRSQRLESIGSLAGGIAHDLNNVFGPIIMAVDLFKLKMTDPQQIELPGNGGLQRAAGRGDGEAGAIVCARSGEPEGVDLPAETRG